MRRVIGRIVMVGLVLLSAAIAAGLARGWELAVAVARAKAFLDEAIRTNPGLGQGSGPVNHHARVAL